MIRILKAIRATLTLIGFFSVGTDTPCMPEISVTPSDESKKAQQE